MSQEQISTSVIGHESRNTARNLIILVLVISSVLSSAFAGLVHPLLLFGALVATGSLLASLVYPDVATILVAFVLYSNAAVVAVQFHGVPYIVSAVVLAALLIPFVAYIFIQRRRIIIDPVMILIFGFVLVQFLGAPAAVRVDNATEIVTTSITEGVFVYFVLVNVIRHFAVLRRVIWAIVIAGTLLGGLTFYQNVTGTFDNNYWGFAQVSNAAFKTSEDDALFVEEQPRLEGPIGEQNRYAQIMIVLVPLALMLFSTERQPLLRVLALLALAMTAIGTALTFSRGAAVGFALAMVIMTLIGYIRLKYVIGLAVGVFLLFQVIPQYGVRLSSLMDLTAALTDESNGGIEGADTSTQSRVTEMLAAGLVFMDHPIVGVGPGMYRYYYREYAERVGIRVLNADRYAHSLFPGIAAEHGILGLGAFIGILGVTLFGLARVRRRSLKQNPARAQLATAFFMVVILYITTGLFLHFGYIRYFWLMIALANVVIILSRREESASDAVIAAPARAT